MLRNFSGLYLFLGVITAGMTAPIHTKESIAVRLAFAIITITIWPVFLLTIARRK